MPTQARAKLALTLLAVASALTAAPSFAHTAQFGEEGEVRYNFKANYGLAKRLEAPNATLIDPATSVNFDDGNRSFKKGAIINNRISLLGEADIRYARNQGVFLRAQAFYDAAYHGINDNDSAATFNGFGPNNRFTDGTRDSAGGNARFLDAYWYGDFDFGEGRNLGLKVGRHVLSWGEALFFANIAGAQSPVDVDKINVPGAQVKDFLLPVGQVSAQYNLNDNFSVMAYTQYEFRETKIPSAGNFWSIADLVGPGSESLNVGFKLPRFHDIKARKSGQWGIGTRYRLSADTEVGAYHLRYHNRAPSVNLTFASATPNYQHRYLEDIKLTGLSLTTRAGDVSVGAELSYKQNTPINVLTPGGALSYNNLDPAFPNGYRGNVVQAQVNALYTIDPNALASGGTSLAAEIVHQQTVKNNTPYELANSKGVTALALALTPSYNDVFTGWNLSVPIVFMTNLQGKASANCGPAACHGTYPSGDSITLLGDKEKRLSIGANFVYMSNLQVGVSLNKFLGKADNNRNPLADRDNLALSVTYNF